MPLYEYECKACGKLRDVVLRLSELDQPVACPVCATPMGRLLSAPHIQVDYPGYVCPVSGSWVEGRAAHKANLAKHGCRILEPGEQAVRDKRLADEDRDFDKKLERTVGEVIHAMPPEKQRKLATELEHGASATVVRQ